MRAFHFSLTPAPPPLPQRVPEKDLALFFFLKETPILPCRRRSPILSLLLFFPLVVLSRSAVLPCTECLPPLCIPTWTFIRRITLSFFLRRHLFSPAPCGHRRAVRGFSLDIASITSGQYRGNRIVSPYFLFGRCAVSFTFLTRLEAATPSPVPLQCPEAVLERGYSLAVTALRQFFLSYIPSFSDGGARRFFQSESVVTFLRPRHSTWDAVISFFFFSPSLAPCF